MCCDLFILYIHFYAVCYLCVKCTSHLTEKEKKKRFSVTGGTEEIARLLLARGDQYPD